MIEIIDHKNCCWAVLNKYGQLQIFAPNGDTILLEWCRVTSEDRLNSAIVKIVVNIARSEEDMRQRIKKLKTK